MKKSLAVALAALSFSAFAAQNDVLITFSTPGPDTYADGVTRVVDGECYALVWTKTGVTFPGFNADGTVVDPVNSKVLIVAPCAVGGRCPPTVFQVSARLAKKLGGGAYGVYLLDTRTASGVPSGVKKVDGKKVPVALNGYGVVTDAETALAKKGVTSSATVRAKNKTAAATVSAVPADAPDPVVKSVRVENGKVYVTVDNTVPYLQYNVSKGATPNAVGKNAEDKNVAAPAQGDGTKEIVLEAPANGNAAFFRVNRN